MPRISVIIPAYNEERLIGGSIRSVLKQTYDDLEIIVVDNGSTDDTVQMAYPAHIVMSAPEIQAAGFARNAGAIETDSDYLAFLDADSRLSANAIARAVAYMDQGAIGGRNLVMAPDDSLAAAWQTAVLNFWGRRDPQYTPFVFATRDGFDAVAGWPQRQELGDEITFQRRLRRRGRFVFDDESFVDTSGRRYHQEGYLKTTLQGVAGYFGAKIPWKPVR